MTPDARFGGRWTMGADALHAVASSGGFRHVPAGRLHAVSGEGLVAGRSVCLAAVALLDPAEWSWPEDPDEADDAAGPLCWICLALTA